MLINYVDKLPLRKEVWLVSTSLSVREEYPQSLMEVTYIHLDLEGGGLET